MKNTLQKMKIVLVILILKIKDNHVEVKGIIETEIGEIGEIMGNMMIKKLY